MTPSYRLLGPFCLALGLASAGAARAQTLADSALEALYVAGKTPELRRLSAQRVAAQADDAQAVLGLALAALARDDAAARTEALQRAETCVARQPHATACQYALGVTLGVQSASEGMMKMARSAGTVREALGAAHEAEPGWYPGRSALMEFYLLAPGMMGGSNRKAAELARSAPTPAQARLLEARLLLADRQFEAAVQALAALPAGLDHALAADQLGWGVQAGLGLINTGKAATAQPLLERLRREHPGQAGPSYALARVHGETGAPAEALALYEQAARLRNGSDYPIDYRIGITLQQLGRVDAARAAFTRFVSAGKGLKATLDDGRKRLAELGG